MPAGKPKSAILMVRSRDLFITPPCIQGYSNLITPDDEGAARFGEAAKYKLDAHYNEDQVNALAGRIEVEIIAPLWDKFLAEAEAQGKDPKKLKRPNAMEYLEDHLKDPKPGSTPELPFIKFSKQADYRDREGKTVRRTMKAYDAKGKLLDIEALKPGKGSIIQPVLDFGLFSNALIKPQPSFGLVGVRILKLEQWGGGSSNQVGETTDDELATLGDDFEAEDLSAFVGGMNAGGSKVKKPATSHQDFQDEGGEEIPF